MSEYNSVFANNDWATIIKACKKNEVPSDWKIGDQKSMSINGVDYLIDIIGKHHDTYADGSGTAPLTFQMHDCYATGYKMNGTATNSGGWESGYMRLTCLPDNFFVHLPTEVQEGIKEVNKLTSAGGGSSTITTTADKLFLLSEVEVFGYVNFSKSGEGTQYAYYSAGNSKVKKKSGSADYWWLRSPRGSNSSGFCDVGRTGGYDATNANEIHAVSFAFCFGGVYEEEDIPEGHVQLKNLVRDGSFENVASNWNVWLAEPTDTSQAKDGKQSLKLGGDALAATQGTIPITVGHKYYGREYIKTAGELTAADCRFEIIGGTSNGEHSYVIGWNRGNFPNWTAISNIIDVVEKPAESYGLRTFTVAGSVSAWVDSVVVVDLTEAFGAGNEPTKEWCDSHIPYFDGTIVLSLIPDAPSDFSVAEIEDDKITLSWSANEADLVYRVYRNNLLRAETTETTFTDSITAFETTDFGVVAYNNMYESAPASLEVNYFPENPVPHLITDRTYADVTRADQLNALWVGGVFTGTTEELAKWFSGLKGAYNATDLNRVGAAVRYLADRLSPYGYVVSVNPKTNWTVSDIPKPEEMLAYINEVSKVRYVLEISNAPKLPEDGERLSYEEANAIEKVLELIDITIDRVVKSFASSASFMFVSGNRPIPTAESNLGRTWEELDAMNTSWENWQIANWYLLLYGNLKARGNVN